MDRIEIEVDGRRVEISHPDKRLFPEIGVTKRDVAVYYARIAHTMLPHLRGRPVTMHRYPDGIDHEGFYQHRARAHFPHWVTVKSVPQKNGDPVPQVICDTAATLVYLAQLACVTPHVWLSRWASLTHPDRLVFDLDPPRARPQAIRSAARRIRAFINGHLETDPFVMTTGSKGVHIVIPLRPGPDFDAVRAIARHMADRIVAQNAALLTTEVRRDKRGGRIFLDTTRNAYGQSTAAPYSLRALPGAPVATPVAWHELADRPLHPQRYTIKNIFRRLGQKEDPWKGMSTRAVPWETLCARLGRRRLDRRES